LHVEVTAGQDHESTMLEEMLDHADVPNADDSGQELPEKLAGDKAYRAGRIVAELQQRGIEPVIPEKGQRANDAQHPEFDHAAYRRRNIVERLVGWLKECRRVLTRFEKTAINYLGMLNVAILQRYLRIIWP